MCQTITAPSKEKPDFLSVFLAGGITKCKEWQDEVIRELEFDDVSIFNPRQEKFDFTDPFASYKQIEWEFDRLETMDMFSMYFCNDNSDQPICMYELGRNVVRMQNRFPADWEKRIVISVEKGYKREKDVLVQMKLISKDIFVELDATPEKHAHYIRNMVRRLRYE